MGKKERKETILDLIRTHRVTSQEGLRELLRKRGIEVTQATLSRDMTELRLVKVMGSDGGARYSLPDAGDHTPHLEALLPTLFLSADSAGNLMVVRTMTGGAQAVGLAIDAEGWPEVLGTVAGDDTVLIVLRDEDRAAGVKARLEAAAAKRPN